MPRLLVTRKYIYTQLKRRAGGQVSCASRGRDYSDVRQGAMNVFDRKTKRAQKNRAACNPQVATYDYLKQEVASQLIDRVADVSR